MIGTLFGVAGRRPAHLSTSVIPPRPGNNCRMRRAIALQRTGFTGYDASVNPVRCNAIARRIRQLFPGLGGITLVERWAGLRPATPNNVPIIGRTRLRKLFLNTGHGTLGWTLACGSAKALAELVSGRKPEVAFDFLA